MCDDLPGDDEACFEGSDFSSDFKPSERGDAPDRAERPRKGDRRGRRRQARRRPSSGRAVTVSEFLPSARFFACDDIVATGCCDDADRCGPGDVFVARLTAAGDGHDDVDRALARGVAGVIAERMIPTFGTPLCIVPESDWALARLTHAFAGDPARRLRVIAITGTSGKTTTAWLAASVLSEAGLRTGVLSDLGCLDADATEPVPADLGRPEVLAGWLGRLADGGCTHVVVEVSSRMLAAHALAGVACDTVVVTNLASAHLDIHGTPAAYRAVKARILDCLGPEGCLVACGDDQRVQRLIRLHAARGGSVLTAGLGGAADVTATPVERSLHGQTFMVRAGGHSLPVAVPTPVASFVRDCLLAVAVGLRQRVPLERIARGIEAAGSVSGRMERIDRGQEHAVFVDQPTSGHAVAATLAGLRRLTRGRLVVIAEANIPGLLCAAGRHGGGGRTARRQAVDTFCRRASRWADECLVVPATMMSDAGGASDIVAYARIDRLLASLGSQDCLLVLGAVPVGRGSGPSDPGGEPMPLAAVVDGWLQLAYVPEPFGAARRAA